MQDVLQRLGVTRERVEAFCHRWNIVRLDLFGSVLRDEFDDQSDVDVLVTFGAGYRPSLADEIQMEDDLTALVGRQTDIIKRHLIETSENWIRRKSILTSAQTVYAASG